MRRSPAPPLLSGLPIWRPSPTQLEAARNKRVRDLIAPGLTFLFCGINPGLYSAATGHHFARPGNRFWLALYEAGFTPRLLHPFEEDAVLEYGLGITNLVPRATATASELTRRELQSGRGRLQQKVLKFCPKILAVVGLDAYRSAFSRPDAQCGLQAFSIGATRIWLLPNPSGLNAHYQMAALTSLFADLRRFGVKLEGKRSS